jgi:cysteine desulfurase
MIYLDYAATTYLRDEVKKAIEPYLSQKFGNPSSFNSFGLVAKEALDDSREKVRKLLNADAKDRLVFTSGGTESANIALQGLAKVQKKGHIITSKIEHHCVYDTCQALEKEGFEVTYVDVDKKGIVDLKQIKNSIKKNTFLITIMYANNEVGTIQPVKAIAKIAKKNKLIFHSDACQAGGILDVDIQDLGVDLMTLNGSKLYGPKGVGLLYVRKGIAIKPILFGGGQEFGLRPGTENIPAIVGFTKAFELAQKEKKVEEQRLIKMRDLLIKGLLKIPDSILNGHPTKRVPNNVNVSFFGVEGESLVLHLDNEGFATATGSACTSQTLEASHVLLAMGVPYEYAHGSLRLTLGKTTKIKDVERLLKTMPKIVETLRKISPFKKDE